MRTSCSLLQGPHHPDPLSHTSAPRGPRLLLRDQQQVGRPPGSPSSEGLHWAPALPTGVASPGRVGRCHTAEAFGTPPCPGSLFVCFKVVRSGFCSANSSTRVTGRLLATLCHPATPCSRPGVRALPAWCLHFPGQASNPMWELNGKTSSLGRQKIDLSSLPTETRRSP